MRLVPKIWSQTIAAHRDAVREATLDATAALIAEHGLTGVSMSQIAKESGIGRATLYKYFPDLESILVAWHERQIGAHLHQLAQVGAAARPDARLREVLRAYAGLSRRQSHGTDLASLLHRSEHIAQAYSHLNDFLTDLIAEAAGRGEVRDDVPPGELAAYCLHALTAAAGLPSQAAIDRLIDVTLTGIRPFAHIPPGV
ncbi:TetR/AcrR family transcriptional regulator [Streptomyces sp.]|uniref:TetR/AcrR family transcriptional regulator n=1 Tax=Streptomyces sp. TaxID=1931 RepID=UPI0034539E57